MTERWRKKLEGIDQVGPNDDVFARAKRGPTLPEPRSPMQRTSTRVVTAIAAFVVFALGISVFAIPALRLNNDRQFISAGNQVQPLWPWDSTDAVSAWRDNPSTIGSTGSGGFAAPNTTAAAFGREVLGWNQAWAQEDVAPSDLPSIAPCSAVPTSYGNQPGPAVDFTETACSTGQATAIAYTEAPYAPTTAAPAFRSYVLFPCAPDDACDQPLHFSLFPSITVVVFQPIGADGPWAVLESKSTFMSISLDPGTELRNGSSIYASGLVLDKAHALLGYHASSDRCVGSGITTGFEQTNGDAGSDLTGGISFGSYVRGQVQVGLSTEDESCAHQPGYAFVTITDANLDPHDLSTLDPLSGLPSGVSVLAFVAVPVTFRFPTAQDTAPPSSTPSTGIGWTTYTDPLGWTIDVPSSWLTRKIAGSDATTTYEGAAFGSATPIQDPGGPVTIDAASGEVTVALYHAEGPKGTQATDDSSLPLAFSDMDPVDGGYLLAFQADGLPFTLAIRVGGDAPTPEQTSILERMVSSISFVPWQPDEERNGWIALRPTTDDNKADQDAEISWQNCDQKGCYVLVYGRYGPGGEGPYILGPIATCGEGENMTADPTSVFRIVLECPDGTTQAWGAPGEPSPNNSRAYDTALNVLTVIRAWDGTLLTAVTTP